MEETKMKLFVSLLLILALTVPAFAEDTSQPQIAYRILSDYLQKQESERQSSRKALSIVSITAGSLVITGAMATLIFEDDIARSMGQETLFNDDAVRYGVVGSSTLVGGLLIGAGVRGLTRPHNFDLRADYQSVFEESDPLVQEAMAAGALRTIADKGKSSRVASAIIDIGTPILGVIVTAITNTAAGDEWYRDLTDVTVWQVGNVVRGVAKLARKSNEELLYDKYLAAREALFATAP